VSDRDRPNVTLDKKSLQRRVALLLRRCFAYQDTVRGPRRRDSDALCFRGMLPGGDIAPRLFLLAPDPRVRRFGCDL